jgi:MerR family transcriptional regulator/heat shock protein HspR
VRISIVTTSTNLLTDASVGHNSYWTICGVRDRFHTTATSGHARGRCKIFDDDSIVAQPDRRRGVYGISTAAELVGTGVQNLRLYETRGLLEPARTDGGTRRYSADDLDRLRRISHLLDAGLNLAGIAMVLQLEDENHQLRNPS